MSSSKFNGAAGAGAAGATGAAGAGATGAGAAGAKRLRLIATSDAATVAAYERFTARCVRAVVDGEAERSM